MKHISNMLILTLVFGLILIGSNAFAQDEETNNEYCGCLTTSGEIKSISINDPNSEPQKPCKNNEKKVCWNEQGVPGLDGLNCWDLNGDGVKDDSEDVNGDGNHDALDCSGRDGRDGVDGMDAPLAECPCDFAQYFDLFATVESSSTGGETGGPRDTINNSTEGATSNNVPIAGFAQVLYTTAESIFINGEYIGNKVDGRMCEATVIVPSQDDPIFLQSERELTYAELDACTILLKELTPTQ